MVEKNSSKVLITALMLLLAASITLNVIFGLRLSKQNSSAFPVTSVEVLDGPSLNTGLNAPATVKTGTYFQVSMMAVNNGNVELKNVLPAPLTTVGNGKAVSINQPMPFSGKLKPGAQAYFAWTYSAEAMGTLEFKGSAAAENTQTAALVTSIETKSNLVTVFPPSVK